MFARLQASHAPNARKPANAVADLPGFVGVAELDDRQGCATTLTLWRTRADAELLDERIAPIAPQAADDAVYEVDADVPGPSRRSPRAAFVGRFNGPVSLQQLTAARSRGERIGSLLAQLPGFVRLVVLWHPTERTMTVIHLAESEVVLHQITTLVTTTPLSPDEDPALLPGPDIVTRQEVGAYRWVSSETPPPR